MKKLLFSLVAAAACGAVTADNVPATATFDSLTADATFDVGKTEAQTVEIDGDNLGYWAVNVATDPELTVKTKSESDKYLSINTGSTPLWRTFTGIGVVASAKAGTLPAGVSADGKVVSSDVKLTACTEWPTLTDFANEKLALFLFAKEEGDTSNKEDGLYAVGGAMVGDPAVLAPTAYRLDVNVDSITNADGWATVAIKTYGDIYAGENAEKLQGFVIAVGAPNSTLSAAVAVEADYAPGFVTSELTTAASTRIGNRTLIPATKVSDGAIAGLGFQGEGGIDNVNLFAEDFATDAVTMSATISSDVTATFTGATFADGALTFTVGTPITFTVASDLDIVTVMYNDEALAPVDGLYTIAKPATTDTLVISAAPAAFQIGDGAKYATLDEALKALKSGDTLKLLGTLEVDSSISFTDADENAISEIELDLNGQTIVAKVGFEDNLIYNVLGTKLTIIDSSAEKTGTVDGGVANEGELIINAGKFNGAVANDGTLTDNGGMFKETDGLPEVTGKEYRDDDEDGYFTLEDEAGSEPETPVVPSIPEADGDVVVDETTGNATVEVDAEKEGDVVVTVPDGFAGAIAAVVPPTVTSISGVPAANITVKVGTVDITGAFEKTTDASGKVTLDLNPEGEVVIDGETIKVEPQLVEDTTAEGTVAPFEVPADGAEANVAAIPGLTYELVTTDDLDVEFGSIVEDGEVVSGAKVKATGKRVNLKDNRKGPKPGRGFYKVKVSK